jgi:methyl-accepting chemotaxis protein
MRLPRLKLLPLRKLYSGLAGKVILLLWLLFLSLTGCYTLGWVILFGWPQGFALLVWAISFTLGLLLTTMFALLVVAHAAPLTEETTGALAQEIAWAQIFFRNMQEKWEGLAQESRQQKHHVTTTLQQTNQLQQSFYQDLQEIVALLKKISSSLERQSTHVKRMTTSLGEMSAAVKAVASHAEVAVTTSKASENNAKKGGDVVNQLIKHMNQVTKTVSKSSEVIRDLRKRSDEIGEIINVIEDIAEQTNLLALNAAIEAARAGAQGRGFAVVADHVRSLAEKTTHATKEIANTLSSIQEGTSRSVAAMDAGVREIDIGATFAVQAGVSLRKIVSGAQNVTETISMIAHAADKQSQTATAITDLVAEVAKEADATCEESKSASLATEELEKQMQQLAQCLDLFSRIWQTRQIEDDLITLGAATSREVFCSSQHLRTIHQAVSRLSS